MPGSRAGGSSSFDGARRYAALVALAADSPAAVADGDFHLPWMVLAMAFATEVSSSACSSGRNRTRSPSRGCFVIGLMFPAKDIVLARLIAPPWR